VRYLKLYLHFLRFSFSRAMQFRLDFTFRIFMDIIFAVISISFYKIIYLNSSDLGGWNENQAIVFVASYLVIDALHMSVFSSNMWWLPFYINRGDLDIYLTRPVSTLFFVSLRDFSANSVVNLFIALGIFIWSLIQLPIDFSLWSLTTYLILLINGFLLYYVIPMIFIIPVFWTQSGRGFNDFFFSMGISIERPDLIYKGILRWVLTVILPFSLIVSFPARIFFGPHSPHLFLHLAGVTTFMWMLMLFLWNKGLRHYSSASS
jgi:ABC-2 type transport system permease protein